MQDHGLFQAICRTNRLDGDDKDFGYIVDYRDLFTTRRERHRRLHLRDSPTARPVRPAPECCSKDRLEARQGAARRCPRGSGRCICEPVEAAQGRPGAPSITSAATPRSPADLREKAPLRDTLYQAVVALVRAYAAIADELDAAGYSDAEQERLSGLLTTISNFGRSFAWRATRRSI
jgi:type I restriction enzyme R subunit